MEPIQVKSIPEDLKTSLPQLVRNFKAALSYVSFYSSDSPFVQQAVQKCHKDLQRALQACGSLAVHVKEGRLFLSDADFSELADLTKILQDKSLRGFLFLQGLTTNEMTSWLKQIALPVAVPQENSDGFEHIHSISPDSLLEILGEDEEPSTPGGIEIPGPSSAVPEEVAASPTYGSTEIPVGFQNTEPKEVSPYSMTSPEAGFPFAASAALDISSGLEDKSKETLLSFVAEAWQYSQLQKKSLSTAPEGAALTQSFDQLFDRLLDRMEKTSPDFSDIHQWFKAPSGELLDKHMIAAMLPLLEVAVRNGWTAVLFDPATEGLVGECLASWGANGKQDLVERSVGCLADSLASGDALERQMALTHLMDARPWVRNTDLLRKVLDQMNRLLAEETSPGLYQSGLLLAWDLMEPAMESGCEQAVLTLLTTLHFHADEDVLNFPERAHIARHWLFERSTPHLIRRFVSCAFHAGQLTHYPLLGEMAAPILVRDFFKASSQEKAAGLALFKEMKEPVRSVLAEELAGATEEAVVRGFIPILRVCGMDPALSLQLSSWLSKGSRMLKVDLLSVIEEVGDPGGGPALRLALFDDSEEIAAMAARIIGKIGFAPALPVLLKAAKIREQRFPNNEAYLVSVCQALGDLALPEGFTFLQEIARKKPLLRGKNFSLPVRLQAVQALTKINKPEVWSFLASLMEEKNPALQEKLDELIQERIQKL